jgi:hypothetical protein
MTTRDEILNLLLTAIEEAADVVESRSRFHRTIAEARRDQAESILYSALRDEIYRCPLWGDFDDLLIDIDDQPLPAGQTITIDLSEGRGR